MRKSAWILLAGSYAFLGVFASAQEQPQQQTPPQEQPQLHEEVTVQWWIVPVYALDKAGAPVLDLSPADLEVYVKGIKVEEFTLHKKTFKVNDTQRGEVPAPPASSPQPPAPHQQKMVFLVFDATSTPMGKFAKAKMICDSLLARSDESAQYVLLSIDPYTGLRYVCGPTEDRNLVRQEVRKLISGKKFEYLLSHRLEAPSGPMFGVEGMVFRQADARSKYQEKIGFGFSISTLGLILGYFPQFSKVIYLFSSRVPWESFNDVSVPPGFEQSQVGNRDLELISSLARALNKSGAFLMMINPFVDLELSGRDVWENSGRENLQSLASESGGRYIAGDQKQIVEQVNNMEGGYYEVSFPDRPEYESQEMSFEMRSKRPEVKIYTLRKVVREKTFADMNERERDIVVLNILDNGPNALTMQKVIYVKNTASREGETLVCRLALPAEFARSELALFKIARDFDTGDFRVATEPIVTESANPEVRLKWRGANYHYDIVLAHLKTGTILVAK